MSGSLLAIYLNDHLAAAAAGAALAGRTLASNRGTELEEPLSRLAGELEEDRRALEDAMRRLGARRDPLKVSAALAGERLGRLKPNGRLRGYSPLSRVVELEALALIVASKLACWRSLRELADREPRLSAESLDGLVARAHHQLEELDRHRRLATAAALPAG